MGVSLRILWPKCEPKIAWGIIKKRKFYLKIIFFVAMQVHYVVNFYLPPVHQFTFADSDGSNSVGLVDGDLSKLSTVTMLTDIGDIITARDALNDDDVHHYDADNAAHADADNAPKRTSGPLVFHYVFTSARNRRGKTFRWVGPFSFMNRRSLESILFHHPNATIVVHSNDIHPRQFDAFTRRGYDVRLRRYGDLETLLADSPASSFVNKLPSARWSPHWYSHESDLLRFYFLYKYGGVYFDTDVVAVNSMNKFLDNMRVTPNTAIVSWTPKGDIKIEKRPLMNCAVMYSTPNHPFLESCLKKFARSYRGNCWACNGPILITDIFEQADWENRDQFPVIDIDSEYWQPISVYGAQKTFLEDQATEMVTGEELWRTDGKCGSKNRLPSGEPAQCNPNHPDGHTCCSPQGWCGKTDNHCYCDGCIDYKDATTHNAAAHLRAARCPEPYPFAYYHGKFCCASQRMRIIPEQGEACNGGKLTLESTCCEGNYFERCPGTSCEDYLFPRIEPNKSYRTHLELLTNATCVHMFGSVVGKFVQKRSQIPRGTLAEFLLSNFSILPDEEFEL